MPRAHLEHPSQATACGKPATQTGRSREAFLASSDRCKSCERTLAASDAGRPAYSGEDNLQGPKLTHAQRRVLAELAEPNDNADGSWYFPPKNLRTLEVLSQHGLAQCTHVGGCSFGDGRSGYAITEAGKAFLLLRET